MELRTALAAAIVLCCGLSGRSLARAAERRYRLLKELLDGLRMLRIQIVHSHEPLERALRLSGAEAFAWLADRLEEGMSVREAWTRMSEEMFVRGGQADCLTDRDRRALERLLGELGQSGSAAQNESIGACIAAMEALLAEAKERADSVGRVYTSVGFLSGLAIAVLIV